MASLQKLRPKAQSIKQVDTHSRNNDSVKLKLLESGFKQRTANSLALWPSKHTPCPSRCETDSGKRERLIEILRQTTEALEAIQQVETKTNLHRCGRWKAGLHKCVKNQATEKGPYLFGLLKRRIRPGRAESFSLLWASKVNLKLVYKYWWQNVKRWTNAERPTVREACQARILWETLINWGAFKHTNQIKLIIYFFLSYEVKTSIIEIYMNLSL